MRELLEKWTRLEPDRCYEVEYGDVFQMLEFSEAV